LGVSIILKMDNAFQLVIVKVRKYTLDSLVRLGLEHSQEKVPVFKPWTILSYFEIVYRVADNKDYKPAANGVIFNKICQQLIKLMNEHPFADFKKYYPAKLFHVLAYQQISISI